MTELRGWPSAALIKPFLASYSINVYDQYIGICNVYLASNYHALSQLAIVLLYIHNFLLMQ